MAADFELSVVIPVFNEEKNIGELLKDWQLTLQAIPVRYRFIIINDGSTDNSLPILQSIAGQMSPQSTAQPMTAGSIATQHGSETNYPLSGTEQSPSATQQQRSGITHPPSTTGQELSASEQQSSEITPTTGNGSATVQHRPETGPQPPIIIHTQTNAGHGPSILAGYQLALDTDWIFQIDSDHQHDPATFATLWENRNRFDFLLGERKEKNATFSRKCVSFISWFIVRLLYGKKVKDVNSPYRLMRSSELKEVLNFIPAGAFAPNILLTAWFVYFEARIFTTTISNRREGVQRQSKMSFYLLRGCFQSIFQTILFRFRL